MFRKSPTDDGGTPIKHYVVELCDITTNNLWTSVAMTETGDCEEQEVLHLREGHKYSFRVAAANRIGQSEPTEGEDIITKRTACLCTSRNRLTKCLSFARFHAVNKSMLRFALQPNDET